jgi:hypothetical protein
MIVAQYSGLWAREGNTFLNAQAGQDRTRGREHWLELRDVRLYEFDDAGRLESIAHAGNRRTSVPAAGCCTTSRARISMRAR